MNSLLIYVLFLALWNCILFFEHRLGLSVILFMIPMMGFLLYSLSSQKKLKNPRANYLMIPILLLSLTFSLFDNTFFRSVNCILIPILVILYMILAVDGKMKLKDYFSNFFPILFQPFHYISNVWNLSTLKLRGKFHLSDHSKKVLQSILITLPIAFVVLFLLSSADMIFYDLFHGMLEFIDDFLRAIRLEKVVKVAIHFGVFYFFVGASLIYLLCFHKSKESAAKQSFIDAYTMKMILTVLNVIYLIFDYIQIKSLFLHSVGQTITYAEYARQGFFQLLFVSIINLTILLISKKVPDKENVNYIKLMSLVMAGLTTIIILSSYFRMNLYEAQYGYTFLRLLVYIALFTETVLLIPTVFYILHSEYPILNSYFVIILSVYVFINFINIDSMIAKRNINRYYETGNLDYIYLENGSTDNVSELIDLYETVGDSEIRDSLSAYFYYDLDRDISGFQEFVLSRKIAQEKLKKFQYYFYKEEKIRIK